MGLQSKRWMASSCFQTSSAYWMSKARATKLGDQWLPKLTRWLSGRRSRKNPISKSILTIWLASCLASKLIINRFYRRSCGNPCMMCITVIRGYSVRPDREPDNQGGKLRMMVGRLASSITTTSFKRNLRGSKDPISVDLKSLAVTGLFMAINLSQMNRRFWCWMN